MKGSSRRWNMIRFVLTALYLWVGWVLFTWSLAPNELLLGLILSAAVGAMVWPVFVEENEAGRRSLLPRVHMLIVYFGLLVFQMYVASFQVLLRILRGRINPGVVHFRTRLRSDIARVALANSITLTPGTITLVLDDDHLIVHWLDSRTTHSRYARRLIAGDFEAVLGRIWV